MLESFAKQSSESLDYTINLYRWLESGEKVTAASAVVDPDTIFITQVQYTDSSATVWLLGGVDSEAYTVSVTIDTNKGRRKTFQFRVTVTGETVTPATITISDEITTVGYIQ